MAVSGNPNADLTQPSGQALAQTSIEETDTEQTSPKRKFRSLAPSADVGMTPVASGATNNDDSNGSEAKTAIASTASATATPPTAPQALSPQARKNRATQQKLEVALTKSLPGENASVSQGLILSLEPEPSGKALTVTLSDDWYRLGPEQQDAIASALWDQRSSLKIQRLSLQDSDGRTLARPPVIGNQVVVLRR